MYYNENNEEAQFWADRYVSLLADYSFAIAEKDLEIESLKLQLQEALTHGQ
jgi:hypothetical protein